LNKTIALPLFVLCVLASPTVALTCVGAAFDTPFPRAVAVETRHVDVPSPRFPGVWQEGFIHGYFYQIFANDEAVLAERKSDADWSISISCQTESCEQDVSGRPPEGVGTLADLLAACLTDPTLSAEIIDQKLAASKEAENDEGQTHALTQSLASPAPETNPEETTPETQNDEATGATPEEADRVPCGLAVIPEGTQGQNLQRLLVLAGANPGRIDGIVGKRTRRAIAEILGPPQGIIDIPSTISELDTLLCQ
jgi:hypothetical protein